LFVVEICGNELKGFVKSLLPSELKNILAELEENKKNKKNNRSSKALKLDELNTSTSKQLEHLCDFF
jgi:hypothetical protein